MAIPVLARAATSERLNAWLNDLDDPFWERPVPSREQVRNDVVGALVFLVAALAMILLAKGMGLRHEGEET